MKTSIFGFGASALGGVGGAMDDAEAQAVLAAGETAGIRYFDTAPYYGYGQSESRIGAFLGGSLRGLTVSTKVGRVLRPARPGENPDDGFFIGAPPFAAEFDYSRAGIRSSFAASKARLGVDSVDLLYLHDIGAYVQGEERHPAVLKQALDEALPEMNALKAEGRVKAIGLGVNEVEVCLEVLAHADLDVIMLAGRYTLLEQTAARALFPLCARRGVAIVSAGPFNSGVLARRDAPEGNYEYGAAPPSVMERARAIYRICAEHGVEAPAAAIQFALAPPVVISVVAGARRPDQLAANVARALAPIPAALWGDLRAAGLIAAEAPTPDQV